MVVDVDDVVGVGVGVIVPAPVLGGLTTKVNVSWNWPNVVVLSTCGAGPGRRIGDLGTLHRFEQRLAELETPVAVVRAA